MDTDMITKKFGPGARIITVTKQLDHPEIEQYDKLHLSWGLDHEGDDALRWVYFHRRR